MRCQHDLLDLWWFGQTRWPPCPRWITYDGLEVSNLEGCILGGHLGDLVVFGVHLESRNGRVRASDARDAAG